MNKGGSKAAKVEFTTSATRGRFFGGIKKPRSRSVPHDGFTIVETLIVLAVTGAMLLIAVAFISGRQSRTQFQTSINDLKQQLEQLVNETASGHYSNNGNFTCVGTGSLVTMTSGSQDQGTNAGCIFLGNAIQFGIGTGDDASVLGVIPIVGKQFDAGKPVELIDTSKPRAVYALGSETVPTDAGSTELMKYGLAVTTAGTAPGCTSTGMCYFVGATPKAAGAIAIVAGDSAGRIASTQGTDLKPGSQQFTLYGVKSTSPTQSIATVAQKMGNYTDAFGTPAAQGLEPATKAVICIASGSTDQSGLFTISADLHVTLQIFPGKVCT